MSFTPSSRASSDRDHAGLGHARRADRAGVLQHDNRLRRDVEVRIVDALLQVFQRVEHQRRAFMLEQRGRRRGELDGGAAGREVAGEDRDRLALHQWIVERPDHRVVDVSRPARDHLADSLARDRARLKVETILQPPPQRRQPAAGVEVLHEVLPRRLEIEQHRGGCGRPDRALGGRRRGRRGPRWPRDGPARWSSPTSPATPPRRCAAPLWSEFRLAVARRSWPSRLLCGRSLRRSARGRTTPRAQSRSPAA